MSLTFQSPVIFVKDIEASKNFYTRFLSQEVEHDFGNNIMFKSSLSLWQIRKGHEIAGIAGDNKNGNTSELYFETENIQDSFEKIRSGNLKFLHQIKTEPWGQMTFRFFDPDGHLVEIGEAMNTFISRIYQETTSIEETSRRTGVPEDTIEKLVR
jgi:catechol 2,3-dioxygenase-like lactoylglutathione lyase family enzyme